MHSLYVVKGNGNKSPVESLTQIEGDSKVFYGRLAAGGQYSLGSWLGSSKTFKTLLTVTVARTDIVLSN